MKKTNGVIVSVFLFIFLFAYGCAPKAVATPPLGVLPKSPAKIKTSALAQAYIDAVDNALRQYANRSDVKVKGAIEFLSWDINSISILTDRDKADIKTFLSGYGIPFDERGIDSGRGYAERQQGIEMEVLYNPDTTLRDAGADLLLLVRLYKGETGRGYFANFKEHRRKYILYYMKDWESYPAR